jgi:hypothetical protein
VAKARRLSRFAELADLQGDSKQEERSSNQAASVALPASWYGLPIFWYLKWVTLDGIFAGEYFCRLGGQRSSATMHFACDSSAPRRCHSYLVHFSSAEMRPET